MKRLTVLAFLISSFLPIAWAPAQPPADCPDWTPLAVPASWEKGRGGILDAYDGIAWYRCFVRVPAEWRGETLYLELGQIDDIGDLLQWSRDRRIGHPRANNRFAIVPLRSYPIAGGACPLRPEPTGRRPRPRRGADTAGFSPFEQTLLSAGPDSPGRRGCFAPATIQPGRRGPTTPWPHAARQSVFQARRRAIPGQPWRATSRARAAGGDRQPRLEAGLGVTAFYSTKQRNRSAAALALETRDVTSPAAYAASVEQSPGSAGSDRWFARQAAGVRRPLAGCHHPPRVPWLAAEAGMPSTRSAGRLLAESAARAAVG